MIDDEQENKKSGGALSHDMQLIKKSFINSQTHTKMIDFFNVYLYDLDIVCGPPDDAGGSLIITATGEMWNDTYTSICNKEGGYVPAEASGEKEKRAEGKKRCNLDGEWEGEDGKCKCKSCIWNKLTAVKTTSNFHHYHKHMLSFWYNLAYKVYPEQHI